jgi:hypothetical protein
MKLNTFLSVFYILIISFSSVLAVHNNIKLSRKSQKFKTKRINTSSFNPEKIECPGDDSIDVVLFVFNALIEVNTSMTDSITAFIRDPNGTGTIEQEMCKDVLRKNYSSEIHKIKDKVYEKVKDALNDSISHTKDLGLSLDQKKLLEKHAKNPRALCEDNIKILKRKQEESDDWTKMSELIIYEINRAIERKFTLPDLKRRSHDIFRRTPKLLMYEYVNNRIPADHDQINIKDILEISKKEIANSWKASEATKKAIHENYAISNCDNLPVTIDNKDRCNNASLASKVVALWNIITFDNVKNCLISFGIGTAINKMIGFAVEKILSIIANMFSLFAVTIIKVVFYAARMLYFIIKATNQIKIVEKSESWGSAAGNAIKIVLTILGIAKKRKFKKF